LVAVYFFPFADDLVIIHPLNSGIVFILSE